MNKRKARVEKKAYENVLVITDELKKLERKTSVYIFMAAAVFILLHIFFSSLGIMLLVSVMFFGIGITILFRRNEDLRLGGILTYPLLLCYSLSNILVTLHFFIVVLVSLPVGILLIRRGYIGQILFFMLALFVFPMTVLSYYFFIIAFPPISVLSVVQHPGTVIYLLMPHIYLYNLMKLPRKKIPFDMIAMALLGLLGGGLWILIMKLVGL